MRGLLIVLLIVLGACSEAPVNEQSMVMRDGFVGGASAKLAANQAPVTMERKLIKNGSISFEVNNVEETKSKIAEIVKDVSGYISDENQNNYGNGPRFSETLRVPSDKLEEVITRLEGLARNVESKNINTQDVTEEFIDVETRLATKKELEARYRELLKQAKTVKDLLEVETQLANVRGEIESMEGRLKYLNNQVSLSTLNVEYFQTVSGNSGFGYRFSGTFGKGWDIFLNFLIGIFTLWPFVLIAGVGTWLFIRWRRRRKQSIN